MAKVIIVDDHADLRDIVTQLLELHGHQVHCCPTAEEAVAQLKEVVPHVLIVDQRLPGMSGVEMLKMIRGDAQLASLRIVVYSADDSQSEQALAAGADEFWLKTATDLFDRVEALGRSLA